MRVMSPQDISAGMLRRIPHNLNQQSCDATVHLIQGVLNSGVDVTKIFVDTVGEPNAYAAKLKQYFPRHSHIEWIVARKADATYPIVGAASIAAKVTRDACVDHWMYAEPLQSVHHPEISKSSGKRKRGNNDDEETDIWATGSGYPGDPKTVRYLKETLDPVFGWARLVRFSWATAKSMLEEPVHVRQDLTSMLGTTYPSSTRAYPVRWIDDVQKQGKQQSTLANFFSKQQKPASNRRSITTQATAPDTRQVWLKDRKMLSEHQPHLWQQLALAPSSATDFF